MDPVIAEVALALQEAEAGVEHHVRHGARCPWCTQKLKVLDTKPWQGNTRIRYCLCENSNCLLGAIGKTIKSIQEV